MYKKNDYVMKTLVLCVKEKRPRRKNSFLSCIYLVYVCTYVYHESAHTWYVYTYSHIFLVIFGIDKDYVILFISHNEF